MLSVFLGNIWGEWEMNLDSNAKVGQRRFRARTCQKSPEEEKILKKSVARQVEATSFGHSNCDNMCH